MIINHWGPTFTKLYHHRWPTSYLSIDTEFTGGNADKDLIMEIGHTLVEDGQVTNRLNLVLDWSGHSVVPEFWVRQALGRVKSQMGEGWRISWDVMKSEGIKPEKALKFYYDLFKTWQDRGLPFVAHNGFYADERMLIGHFAGFLGKKFRFGENSLFDTGAIFKASQAMDCDIAKVRERQDVWLPRPGDSMETYFRRVTSHPAKGVFWRLWNCVTHFGLDKQYSLEEGKCHGAGYDSYLVHLLFEEFRKRVTEDHSGESGCESPEALARMFDVEMAKTAEAKVQKARQAELAEDEFEERQGATPKVSQAFLERRRRQRRI